LDSLAVAKPSHFRCRMRSRTVATST